MMFSEIRVGFIGGGNMAEAIIKGLLAGGIPSSGITVSEPVEKRRSFLQDSYGVTVTMDNSAAVAAGSVIVMAVKPQVCGQILEGIAREDFTGETHCFDNGWCENGNH